MNSAFPEDWFENDGTGIVIHGGAQCFEIVARHKLHIFQEWLEALAVLILAGQRHGAESSPVI